MAMIKKERRSPFKYGVPIKQAINNKPLTSHSESIILEGKDESKQDKPSGDGETETRRDGEETTERSNEVSTSRKTTSRKRTRRQRSKDKEVRQQVPESDESIKEETNLNIQLGQDAVLINTEQDIEDKE